MKELGIMKDDISPESKKYMYEYFKLSKSEYKYKCIEQLCNYIHHIFNGFDYKLMLLFYTNDLIIIYKDTVYENIKINS